MGKIFFLDTCILLEDPSSIDNFYEDGKNQVVIPYSTILELDRLKKNINKSHLVHSAVVKINTCPYLQIYKDDKEYSSEVCCDDTILKDFSSFLEENKENKEKIIFVTNDKILQIRIRTEFNIESEEFLSGNPFTSDSEIYTGVINDGDEKIKNAFYWKSGKLYSTKNDKLIDYENEIWKVSPKTVYQNMLMELLLDNDIDIITIQSGPGYGKTHLALAAALQLAFQKDKKMITEELEQLHEEIVNSEVKKRGRKKKIPANNSALNVPRKKIYVIRPTTIIGDELGFLPGDLSDKIDPYFRPIKDLLYKLHQIRPCYKLFNDGDPKKGFDTSVIEFLPVTYLRGMNIENAIVIIDEIQNLTRSEVRTTLSRMGENVRCFITGDKNDVCRQKK